jgi:transcriptional regulator with GAF, ATPase, and Fis domain
MEDKKDLFRKSEEFLPMISKTKEFTEELLKENERLRYRLAALEAREGDVGTSESMRQKMEEMLERLRVLEAERRELEQRYRQVEEENKDFANRYLEIEEQNNNLANLYVASYQLHSTLDFNEVIRIVMEIIINLVGAETFCILLLDEKTNDLRMVANEGLDEYKNEKIQVGTGKIGGVAKAGEPYYINQELESISDVDFYNPQACIPLKIKEHVIGVISIYKLFVQKEGFTAVDYELFTLLAGHAATAIFSSKLYSQSERKLSTIQGFLDLLTN